MNKSDLRVIKTKRLLGETMITLLQQESFKDVTVQQLCDESLTARSTFYRHYSDKYALLEEMVKHYTDDFEKYITERMHQKDITAIVQQLAHHLVENRQAILSLLNVHEEHANLSDALQAILCKHVLQLINARQLAVQIQVPAHYLANLYVSNTMTFITWTLTNGEDNHIVHLMNRIQNSLVINK
ncbi:TetR/AcrR family transcriptional regulator [Sporolactobacillus pectinivorans]|uniref:TetR/AcrR family transcriptional regulator n=1 Tax=Sporolactobacillus pectinivorans TaxID=1591408 RepID=UPI000C26C04F|nr:TetR/AcrR family transcriptional regulator [Sporolactobacillus pectinivorans]